MGFGEIFDYMAGQADWLAFGLPTEGNEADRPRAGDLARDDVPTCALTDTLGDARAGMRAAGWDSCIVIDARRIVLGRVRAGDLDGAAGQVVETVMEPGPTTVRRSEYADALVGRMKEQDVSDIIVTTSIGELVGVFCRDEAERRLRERSAS